MDVRMIGFTILPKDFGLHGLSHRHRVSHRSVRFYLGSYLDVRTLTVFRVVETGLTTAEAIHTNTPVVGGETIGNKNSVCEVFVTISNRQIVYFFSFGDSSRTHESSRRF